MINLSVKIGRLKLSNPVLVASGTFGYGEEFGDLFNPGRLGAIITKTITLLPREGNPMPRIIETPCGLLNSIGLQNEGIDSFVKRRIPRLARLSTKVIVSIAGESAKEFKRLTEILDRKNAVDAIELNLSCPNIRARGKLIAQSPKTTYQAVRAARKSTKKTLFAKLSPNVTDIVCIARSACEAGCDALSLINTVYGMSVDLEKKAPHLAGGFGGLSGPAIKPVALYTVYRVARSVKIPIIGMGGIMNAADALEFILAGATVVAIGTANFINPRASIEIIQGIKEYLIKHRIKSVESLVGTLRV